MGTKKSSGYLSPIARVFDKFSRQQDVSLIFGEPIHFENKKVLPVAKINYIVGGGGGYSGATENPLIAQGEGGGGHISVRPLGVYEIDAEKVKFKPIIDLKFTLALVAVFTLGLVWLLKRTR